MTESTSRKRQNADGFTAASCGAESGASFDCIDTCTFRDTAFGSIYPLSFINALSGSDYRSNMLFQEDQWAAARAASAVPWDLAVVLVNTPRSGGMAVHVATVGRDEDWPDTARHEFSHLLGLVGDEYETDACIVSDALGLPGNIARDPEDLPWDYWVAVDPDIQTSGHAFVTTGVRRLSSSTANRAVCLQIVDA